MDPQPLFCPKENCPSRGVIGAGNLKVHQSERNRWKCKVCKQTFSGRAGTPLFGLKTEAQIFVWVVTLLAFGCPIQAIVAAFRLDERTVAEWQRRAGQHCERVHKALVEQPQDLKHVEADEIRVRCQKKVLWLAMAIAASSKLWLGAVVSPSRDKHLARALAKIVHACSRLGALLLVTDGWVAYQEGFAKAFRTPVHTGEPGRPLLLSWPDFVLVQTVKWQEAGRTIGIRVCHLLGNWRHIASLLPKSQVVSTAYIERLNATFRQRLAGLCRRTRCLLRSETTLSVAVYLVGAVYNFCTPHTSLQQEGQKRSPAMAAGLTHTIWTVEELLSYHLAPPPYVAPKRRGPKPKNEEAETPREAKQVVTA
jgi:transposase-like protein/IS1 family transposase